MVGSTQARGPGTTPGQVIVVGAGIGGLTAAVELAGRGYAVTVLERAGMPGGKMRETQVAGHPVDAGPTVLTMRWVFEEIFAAAGTRFADHVQLDTADVLARHAWADSPPLDLYADLARSADAVGAFAGAAEARNFLRFHAEARRIYEVLRGPYLCDQRPNPVSLTVRIGLTRLPELFAIRPFETMWRALSRHFTDPRLRQLFGRYATYCGSSPYDAPATLMLVAHVEQDGVWLVRGGMQRIARALASLAERRGATIRYGAEVREIVVERGRATGVMLADGERIAAADVICNADPSALRTGRFGAAAGAGLPTRRPPERSLSALTWALHAETAGFPLQRHNVFFSGDYRAEFVDLLERRRLPAQPTVYVCAQDRRDDTPPGGAERLLCLVNAPATGDAEAIDAEEFERCEERTFEHLEQLGLRIARQPGRSVRTGPRDFERSFPATGGALYGQASHGWLASFTRPAAATRVAGLYLAGGSAHPGPGVPMAALSGRLAAARLLRDRAST
jgi:1-hydroxycarotenoid 3,4-desaturase